MFRLTNRGFSHLLVPVLAFLMVAGIGGAYLLATSHAAPAPTTASSTSTTTTSPAFEPSTGPEPSTPGVDATDNAALTFNAQKSAEEIPTQGIHLCLYYDNTKCIVTHGVGTQATIQGTGTAPTKWTEEIEDDHGVAVVMFYDGSGNCLRSNSDQQITLERGLCNLNQDGEVWLVTRLSPLHFKSYKYRNNNWFMGTSGTTDGYKVWDVPYGKSGSWISWTFR